MPRDYRSFDPRRIAAGLGAVLLLLGAPYVHARTIDGRIDDWIGTSTDFGGTSQYSNGELVYQDYLHDDFGPDTGQRSTQLSTTSIDHTIGDFRYPTDEARFANNCADIDQVRFAADDDNVYVLVRLNSLRASDTTVVALGFDLDRSPETGGGTWPFAAGFSAAGTDAVLTVAPMGAVWMNLATGSSLDLSADLGGSFAVDPEANAIEISIPRSALPGPRWDVRAASGLWDAAAGEWLAAKVGDPERRLRASAPRWSRPEHSTLHSAPRSRSAPRFRPWRRTETEDGSNGGRRTRSPRATSLPSSPRLISKSSRRAPTSPTWSGRASTN